LFPLLKIVGKRNSRRTAVISRVAACALLASWLIACHRSYHPVPAATIDSGSSREYRRLLVVTRDGYELQLVHAFIRPDSVVGFEKGKDRGLLGATEEPRRLAFGRDQIVRVESYEYVIRDTTKRSAAKSSKEDDAEAARGVVCLLTLWTHCPPPPSKPRGTPVVH